MKDSLINILDWSEVWALFIPLAVLWKNKKQPIYFKPVIIYVWLALVINLLIDLIWKQKSLHLPLPWHNNNPLYNVHSIVRFICFSSFFILLRQPFLTTIKKVLPILSLLFIIINFTFLEKFINYSSFSARLLTIEAGLLLLYCLQYYLFKFKEDVEPANTKQVDFWVVTGLSIYVVINFFYFLFYPVLIRRDVDFAIFMWNVHNVAFIFFCVFLAKAFYESERN